MSTSRGTFHFDVVCSSVIIFSILSISIKGKMACQYSMMLEYTSSTKSTLEKINYSAIKQKKIIQI